MAPHDLRVPNCDCTQAATAALLETGTSILTSSTHTTSARASTEITPVLSSTASSSAPLTNPANHNRLDDEKALGTIDIAETTLPQNKTAKLLPIIALTSALFLVALDTTLLPTALPTISHDFNIPSTLYSWTGSSYLLANATSIPLWGRLSDVFGRKPVLLLANIIFLIGGVIGGCSRDVRMLIAGRAVMGLGGGGVVVLVHICVADMFGIRERSLYLGILGAAWAVASALGPVLGGILASTIGWRWCFWINLPVITLATLILTFTLHLHNPRTPLWTGLLSIDYPGTLTIIPGTLLLLIGLQIGGQTHPWSSAPVLLLLITGILSYLLFLLTQYLCEKKTHISPIMPLKIFSDPSNLSALTVCFTDALVFNSTAYLLPLYFQTILSYPAQTSGLLLLALATPLTLISLSSGFIMQRTGRYLEMLRTGMGIMTLALSLFTLFPSHRDLGMIIGFPVLLGVGFGPNFHAPLLALQSRTREGDMAAATSTFGFVRMVAGAIGVVLGQVVFQSRLSGSLEAFLAAGIEEGVARALSGGGAMGGTGLLGGLTEVQVMLVKNRMTEALRSAWVWYAVVSGVGLLVSFGISKGKLGSVDDGVVEETFEVEGEKGGV